MELNGKLLSTGNSKKGLTGYLYYIPDSNLTSADDTLTNLDQVLGFVEDHPESRFSFFRTWDKIQFHETSDIYNGWEEDEWFSPSYSSGAAILKRRFAGIFTGFINIDTSGEYKFFVTSNEGFRLKINNQVVTEHPDGRGAATSEETVSLNKGLYPIELTYFEKTGKKCLTLEWDPPGSVSREVIPKSKLYNGRYLLVRATPKKPTVVFTNDKGSNNKVNVSVGAATTFTVNATEGSTGVDIARYRWQKKTGSDAPGAGYSETTDDNYNFTFDNAGEYTVYCQVVDEKGVESDGWVGISVRAWNRPVVHDTPPQERIDAGDVSWFDGKYVGVAGQSVRLMGDGETGTTGEGEEIAKYLWYLNSEWVEQPPDEVLSHTWDNPSTNDQVKCKAETNYGIQSEEKSFSLRIYNNLEVDSGNSYTGKPNSAITLKGSINTDSYPGASFEYQWRVDSATPTGEVKGDTIHQGDYIELTVPDPTHQYGQFEYTDLPLSDDWSVIGEFKTWDGIGSEGAHAFYTYVWASETPQDENSARGQYSINFDEYQDEIQLKYDGNTLEVVSQNGIDNGEWRPFRVEFYKGEFKVYLDHQLKLTYDDSANYQTRMSNNLFGFGGRTGSWTNYHCVRNMKWTTGDPIYTDNSGEGEYTWTEDGTYQTGFTAKVTTTEGLVLEDTAFADVTVESGKPTAMPGGPYRGGIAGGSFSPVQFEGNHPDFVEADDIGHIEDWTWFFSDGSNGALELDGQDDHVILNPMGDFPTTEITAEFWMKSSDDARRGTPMSYASTQHDNDFLIYDYKNFAPYVAGVSTGATGVSANDGEWHHIALTWKSSDGELKFYKDGALEYTHSEPIAAGEVFASNGAFVLGQEQDSIGGSFDRDQAFAGAIDEVRIWNVARSGDSISKDMSRKLTGDEQGLVLYWTFEEGQNTEVNDQSSYGSDGTLVVTNDGNPESPDNRWIGDGHPPVARGIWNPAHSYPRAGKYQGGLKVKSEFGKWSTIATADVEVIDGKIAGYVRAADLRTPVREVQLTLSSSHVDPAVLGRIADSDDTLNTTEGRLWTLTNDEGYYEFNHIPLGSYRIRANKGEGNEAHEFEKTVQATELTKEG